MQNNRSAAAKQEDYIMEPLCLQQERLLYLLNGYDRIALSEDTNAEKRRRAPDAHGSGA